MCTWLTDGAPAGLNCVPQGLDAIFPRTQEDDAEDPENFDSGCEFINHSCAASGPGVAQQLQGCADRGWLEEVTYQGLQQKFGANFTVSDFFIVAKTKNGTTKKRMILDLKGKRCFETCQEDTPGGLAEVFRFSPRRPVATEHKNARAGSRSVYP